MVSRQLHYTKCRGIFFFLRIYDNSFQLLGCVFQWSRTVPVLPHASLINRVEENGDEYLML